MEQEEQLNRVSSGISELVKFISILVQSDRLLLPLVRQTLAPLFISGFECHWLQCSTTFDCKTSQSVGCMMQDCLKDSAGASLILEWMVMTQVINSSAPTPSQWCLLCIYLQLLGLDGCG